MTNNINRKLENRFFGFILDSHALVKDYGHYTDLTLNWISIHHPNEYDTMLVIAHQIKSDENRYKEIAHEYQTNPEMYAKYIKEDYTFEEYVRDNYPNEYEDIMDTYDFLDLLNDIQYNEYEAMYDNAPQ